MTGTVLDGNIDVALLKNDGLTIDQFGAYTLAPYRQQTVEMLRACVDAARDWQFSTEEPVIFEQTERQLTIEQSAAVKQLVADAGMAMHNIGVVGFHGQTILHRPPLHTQQNSLRGQTRQLGDGQLMSDILGVPVVNDFRGADMQAGGQGAPLSAIYHQALLHDYSTRGDTAVLNLGGVANLTWWDGKDRLIAFDTGPANAPINDFVRHHGLGVVDHDGALAARGTVDEPYLQQLLEHPYLSKAFPKSLDRFSFSWRMAEQYSAEDGAALLTAFSAAAVAKGLELLPQHPRRLIVCGGGRHNPSLMKALQQRTNTAVYSAESAGWRGDAVEAECFAYLAVRSARELPISFPDTTGVTEPVCGGQLHNPSAA